MQKFGWSRVAILQQAEEVFISVNYRESIYLKKQFDQIYIVNYLIFKFII